MNILKNIMIINSQEKGLGCVSEFTVLITAGITRFIKTSYVNYRKRFSFALILGNYGTEAEKSGMVP